MFTSQKSIDGLVKLRWILIVLLEKGDNCVGKQVCCSVLRAGRASLPLSYFNIQGNVRETCLWWSNSPHLLHYLRQ